MANVNINLDLITKRYEAGAKRVLLTSDKVKKKAIKDANDIKKSLKGPKDGYANLGKSLLGTLGVFSLASRAVSTLTSAFTESVVAAGRFELAIAEINTILPKNEKLTQKSISTFRRLSETFGLEAQAQAKAFYSIVSAGVKGTSKQLDTLQISNKAAIAGLVDIDTATKVLVSSVNAYATSGLTATQASDALFSAVREGQTTFGELASSLGNVAPVASAAGLKFTELTGALAAITKAGVRTDIAVTGVRALLSTLIKPSAQASKFAKQLGIDFTTAGLRAKGFAGFMKELQDVTGGSEVALGKLFPNVRALTPILQVVSGNFDDFNRILKATENSLGDTNDAFKIIQLTDTKSIERASEVFTNLFSVLGGGVNKVIGTLAREILFLNNAFTLAFRDTSPIENLTVSLQQAEATIKSINTATPNFDTTNLENQAELIRQNIDQFNKLSEATTNPISLRGKLQQELEQLQNPLNIANTIFDRTFGAGSAVLQQGAQGRIAEIRAELEKLSKVNVDSSGDAGGINLIIERNEQALQKEKELVIGLAAIRQQAALQKEQIELEAKEAAGVATEEDLLRLSALELRKIEITRDADLKRAALIKDSTNAKLTAETAAATASLAIQQKSADQQKAIDAKSKAKSLSDQKSFFASAKSLGQSGSKELVAISQAAGIAEIAIKTPQAVASSYAYGTSLGGPILGGVFGAIAAAAMATQAANIASAGSFEQGGVIGGSSFSGDKLTANVNSGEMVLNKGQQAELFNQANGGGSSSGGQDMSEIISAIQNMTIVLRADDNEIARSTSRGVQNGVAIGQSQ